MRIEAATRSPEETRDFGQRVGALLPERALLFLNGELGSGKTWFTKGVYLGRGGTDADLVVSPSYTLVHVYEGADAPFHHVDLYRLENPEHLHGLEYEEFLYFERGTAVLEWPRSAGDLVEDEEILRVEIARGDDPECDRRITIDGTPNHYARLFEELASPC